MLTNYQHFGVKLELDVKKKNSPKNDKRSPYLTIAIEGERNNKLSTLLAFSQFFSLILSFFHRLSICSALFIFYPVCFVLVYHYCQFRQCIVKCFFFFVRICSVSFRYCNMCNVQFDEWIEPINVINSDYVSAVMLSQCSRKQKKKPMQGSSIGKIEANKNIIALIWNGIELFTV